MRDERNEEGMRSPPARGASRISPRLLSREEAAAYCGVSPRAFSANVAKKVRKTKIGRAVRYDLRALDNYLNRLAGLAADASDDEALALKALDGLGTSPVRHRAA